MQEEVYTDAARFKQLSVMLLDANFHSFPNRTRIETIAAKEPGLRAWIKNYRAQNQFMSDAKFFFYRERNRRELQCARRT